MTMQKRLILSGVAECKEESLTFSWGLGAVRPAFCPGEDIAKVCLLGREENKVISKTQCSHKGSRLVRDAS